MLLFKTSKSKIMDIQKREEIRVFLENPERWVVYEVTGRLPTLWQDRFGSNCSKWMLSADTRGDGKRKRRNNDKSSNKILLLLLVRQMETPVSSMKVAVHRKSLRLPYSLRATGVWSGQIPFLSGS